jgi:putative aldouronate transport system permease protein
MNTTITAFGKRKKNNKRMSYGKKMMKMHWQLYLIILLPLLYVIIFSYVPMYGVQLGFKQYYVSKGITGSPWVGLKFFKQFFSSTSSWLVIKNTITISLYSLIAGFPLPIILAVALNEARNKFFKKTVQMVTYAPYFISTVVMVGMLFQILDPQIGIVAKMLGNKAGQLNLLGDAKYFKSLYVWSGIWQGTGYSSIIYLAALAGVDPSLQEAAIIDGASKVKRIWHVDLPSIAPTIVILLILSVGGIMSVGFEKVYLMQNSMNASSSEIISTYVYKVGLVSANFSFSTAIGLFNSVVNLILLASVNFIAKKLGETSLW